MTLRAWTTEYDDWDVGDFTIPALSYDFELHDTLDELQNAYDRHTRQPPGYAAEERVRGAFLFVGVDERADRGPMYLGIMLLCRPELCLDIIAHESVHAAVYAAQIHNGHVRPRALVRSLRLPVGDTDTRNREELIAYLTGVITQDVATTTLDIHPYAPEVDLEEPEAA
jgi:hypothetical protein